MPSWAHLIHIISKAQANSQVVQGKRVWERGGGREAGSTLSFIRVQACLVSANVGNVWLNYVMILQQLLSVSYVSASPFLFSPSFPLPLCVCAPLSVICSYFRLLILRAETFCKCFHYASHVAKRQRQRRLQAEATLITLCLSLINFSRIYYLNAFMCVCSACVRVCGWKGHPKLGQVFGARRHHFKSQLSRTHAKAANTLVTSMCVCVCACVLDHVPRPILCVWVSHFMLDLSSSCVCLVWLL